MNQPILMFSTVHTIYCHFLKFDEFNLTYKKDGKQFDPPQKVDDSVVYEMEPIVETLKIAEEDSHKE